MTLDLNGLTGVLTAIGAIASSQGVVAWIGRRQLRADVGDTSGTPLVDRFDRLEGDVAQLRDDFASLADTVATSLNRDDGR